MKARDKTTCTRIGIVEERVVRPKAKWTVMIYMAGDNNLSSAGDKDLNEMRTVGSTEAVNIVVEFDNAGQRGTNRIHIQTDGTNEQVVSMGETDSGNPEMLVDFVRWAAENYVAERYALILWNHGSGWQPEEIHRIAKSVSTPGYEASEATERVASALGRCFFRTSLETILRVPSNAERAICSDDGSGHSLDTLELGNVLAQVVEMLGQPLDLLGMDACLMSNVEVAYQARQYAKYMVASEEDAPSDGWPYAEVLGWLVKEPHCPTANFAAHIVDVYVGSYRAARYHGPVTLSALDLSKVVTFAETLDKLADASLTVMAEAKYSIWQAKTRTPAHFCQATLWDVGHLCNQLCGITTGAVQQAAAEVVLALQAGAPHFVIAEGHYGKKVDGCFGVTIYNPPEGANGGISRFYSDLDFAKYHRWLPMLKAYFTV
jgi:hypothetical protein